MSNLSGISLPGLQRETVEMAFPALLAIPELQSSLAFLLPLETDRCVQFIVRLGILKSRFKVAIDFRMLDFGDFNWTELFAEAEGDKLTTIAYSDLVRPSLWKRLVEMKPEFSRLLALYAVARKFNGLPLSIPESIMKVFNEPERIVIEIEYLQRLISKGGASKENWLRGRLHNLKMQASGNEPVRKDGLSVISRKLAVATAREQLAAGEKFVDALYSRQLSQLIGKKSEDIKIDNALVNALGIWTQLSENKKLAGRLIRNHCSRDFFWNRRLFANKQFEQKLNTAGINSAVWLAENRRIFECAPVTGGRLEIHLENNPLEVLQMGNYFDTCLSFGGVNSHATVLNAIDFNKRVLYATDGKGKVVGRKLIAITADMQMIGYYSYTNLPSIEANKAVKKLMLKYCGELASRAGMELADDGVVQLLCGSAWYDDGAVRWPEQEMDAEHPSTPVRTRANGRG